MKTAVSIPDDIFERADRLAQELKTSRSGLYSRALKELLDRHDDDRITESWNRVADATAGGEDDEADAFRRRAVERRLRAVEW